MSGRGSVLGVSLAVVLSAIVALFANALRIERLDAIDGAFLVERPGSEPSLLLSGRTGEGEAARFGWMELELTSGQWMESYQFPNRSGAVTVRTVGGSSVLYRDAAGDHIREITLGLELGPSALGARWPQLAPWRQTVVIAPGILAVESVDGRFWALDIANGEAKPIQAPSHTSDLSCASPGWIREEGQLLRFVPGQNDRNDLVRITPDGEGGSTSEPISVSLPHASLLCDERTNETAVFRDGAALIALWTSDDPPRIELAKMRADGRIAWGYDTGEPAHPEVRIALFGMGHTAVVQVGDSVMRIRADGVAEWRQTM